MPMCASYTSACKSVRPELAARQPVAEEPMKFITLLPSFLPPPFSCAEPVQSQAEAKAFYLCGLPKMFISLEDSCENVAKKHSFKLVSLSFAHGKHKVFLSASKPLGFS